MSLGSKEAIVTLAVSDLDAARTFYEEKLGLRPTPDQEEGTLSYQSGKSAIFVYPSQYAGTNQATAVTWIVDDVEGTVSALRGKGVTFEHYPDLPDTKIEGDLHVSGDRKLAWFKDPDGNIHALAGGM
jgi:catechol 2,3-dioxygenase-like lactoylglutathione lyase family enzyme